MKKFLLASFATLSITAAGVGVSASSSDAHAAETTQASQSTESVHQQFLNAGGTEELWQKVVLPESGGNPDAVNELGYQGLGQTKESWGTGSVEEQTKGMVQYAKERYGSIDEAISFREANGWW